MVTLHTYATLPSSLAAAVEELDALCFRKDYTQTAADLINQAEKYCSEGDLIAYILAKENNVVIGETRIYKRTIRLNSQNMVLGGVGSVGTHPNKRSRGVASSMMKK